MANVEISEAPAREYKLVHNAPFAMVCAAADGKLIDINEAGQRLLGLDGEDHQNQGARRIHDFYAFPEECERNLRDLREKGSLLGAEFKSPTGKGWLCAHYSADQETGEIFGYVADITDRKNKEAEEVWERETLVHTRDSQLTHEKAVLRHAELQYRVLIDNTSDAIWSVDPQFCFQVANQTVRRYFRAALNVEITQGHSVLANLPEKMSSRWQRRFQNVLDTRQRLVVEENIGLPNIPEWFEISLDPIIDEDEVIGIACFARDISSRKRYEAELERTRERLEVAGTAGHIGFWEVSREKEVQMATAEFTRLIGYEHKDSSSLYDFVAEHVHKEDAERISRFHRSLFGATGQWGETELRYNHPQKGEIWLYTAMRSLAGDTEGSVVITGFLQEITERKAMVSTLKESENLFRKIFENTAAGIVTTDLNGNVLEINEEMCEILGYQRDELKGKNVQTITHLRDVKKEMALAQELMRGEKEYIRLDKRYIHKSGAIVYARLSLSLIRDEGNRPLYAIGLVQDVTEQRKAQNRLKHYQQRLEQLVQERTASLEREVAERRTTEERLLRSRKQLRMLLDFAPFGAHLYSYEKDDRLVLTGFSQSANRILQTDHTALLGKTLEEMFPAACTTKLPEICRRIASSGEPFFSAEVECHHDLMDGIYDIQVIQAAPAQAVVFFSDITQRKKARERVEQSLREKEVLLRELYHRTKNNMQVIGSMLDLQAAYSPQEGLQGIFQEIENRIVAMALVHQKLYQSQDLSRIDLGEYIAEVAGNLQKTYVSAKQSIEIRFSMMPVYVLIDIAIPCGLVLNEIITNALKHAFPNDRNGSVEVQLRRRWDYVIIRVCDNGIGIQQSTAVDDGGLGMQLVRSIVQNQLKGRVRIDICDPGTRVSIMFQRTLYKERI